MGKRATAEEIDEQAFRWVARLDRDGEIPELLEPLSAWLAEDPRHQGAYLQAQAIWLRLDRASQAEASSDVSGRPAVTRRQVFFGAGGAALAAAIGGAWILTRGESFVTSIGEIRHLPLADGSTAYLNTQSRLAVDMQPSIRRLRLARGEAWFQVEKDADRPFVVAAGSLRVRAVGTAFSVRLNDRGAEVMVSEGVVEAWMEGAGEDPVRVSAGERAVLTDRSPLATEIAAPSEIDRKLAWREGKIHLEGETLQDAVAEFNRYNRRQIVLQQSSIAGKRFFGVFRTDDPEGFCRSIHLALKIPVSINGDVIIIGGA